MPSLPQGAFAVHKLREHKKFEEQSVAVRKKPPSEESKRRYDSNQFGQLAPVKYNEKMMNSIWGRYNRKSPHNFKKNNGAASNGEDRSHAGAKDLAFPREYSVLSPSPTYFTHDIHGCDRAFWEEMLRFSM